MASIDIRACQWSGVAIKNDVDVLALEQAAVVLGDPVLVLALRIETATLGGVVEAPPVSLPPSVHLPPSQTSQRPMMSTPLVSSLRWLRMRMCS